MEKEKIHQLAISYFEGNISLEDESLLFEFIYRNESNIRLFRDWEKGWMYALDNTHIVKSEWDSLQTKIETRKAINPILKPKAKQIPLYRKIAAIAAVAAAIIISTLVVDRIFITSHEEGIFIVEAPSGEKSRIILPDGSIVWLNSSSQITYSSQFGEKNRSVRLDGEAYFEVNKKDNLPFTVKTSNYDVVVRGTKFNVSTYTEDMKVTTTLMEGKVDVICNNSVLSLDPGESLQLNIEDQKFYKTHVKPEQYKSWIENKIEYDSIPIDELLNRLSRQYDVNIHLEKGTSKPRYLNISIKNDEQLKEILEGLAMATPMQIEYKGQDIYIKLK